MLHSIEPIDTDYLNTRIEIETGTASPVINGPRLKAVMVRLRAEDGFEYEAVFSSLNGAALLPETFGS